MLKRSVVKYVVGIVGIAVAASSAGQSRGGRGGAPVRPEPLALDDHAGFESIFDGTSMKGWDGDPAFWRAENGELSGQSTAEKPVKQNTLLLRRGGEPADSELKVEYSHSDTN